MSLTNEAGAPFGADEDPTDILERVAVWIIVPITLGHFRFQRTDR